MDRTFSSAKIAGTGASSGVGAPTNAEWSNESNITADDANDASIAFNQGGQLGDTLEASNFGFPSLPDGAVIDGIEVYIEGDVDGSLGTVSLSGVGTTDTEDMGSLNKSYGGASDLWGAASIDPDDLSSLEVHLVTTDISGGDGTVDVNYIQAIIYWHIEMPQIETDVPIRVAYKVYSRDGKYIGELPNVTNKFAFAQDKNTAGSSIVVTCAQFVTNPTTVVPLQTEAGTDIETESGEVISATETELLVTTGNSPDLAIYKNSNRVKVWLTNKYYPNGKLMFSGEINRVQFKYGGNDPIVKLTIYSDGLDMSSYIARGYPFTYTVDQSQTSYDASSVLVVNGPYLGLWALGEFDNYGQTFKTGAGITNIGAITIRGWGTADVTITLYDAVDGNFISSTTKSTSNGSAEDILFEFAQLVDVEELTEYYFELSVGEGQIFNIKKSSAPGPYADGTSYFYYFRLPSSGSRTASTNDLYFKTHEGEPTTTATYTSDDPVADMASGILTDYNNRGGYITEGDFEATGLSLTYTFVVATVLNAIAKIIDMSPTGYYYYVDLGTSELNIKKISTTADFIVTRGRHIAELDLTLTIEQVKNYLLLSGGDTGSGVNLFRDYTDSESVSNYGIRTATKSDNRLTLAATADAIGETFIEENADEIQQTTLLVKGEHIDITQLTPGKTIGFRNFGNFIDDMVLQIVRREPNFSDDIVRLTLGQLPVRTNDEVENIKSDLTDQQTIDNPTSPS